MKSYEMNRRGGRRRTLWLAPQYSQRCRELQITEPATIRVLIAAPANDQAFEPLMAWAYSRPL